MQKYYATKEQIAQFDRLKRDRAMPISVAFFCFCAAHNVPYRTDIETDDWEIYLKHLKEEDHAGFAQGETSVDVAIEQGMVDEERWKHQWGVGDEAHPYTKDDYIHLDDNFRRYAARLNAAGGYDLQQEDVLRHCSRLALLRDQCVARGDKESVDKAAKLDKMIQDNLAAENLRKKDAKPIESARVDGIVDALRKKYGVGMELTQEQAAEVCARWMSSHHYPVTMDAVEHALLSIINCTRGNNDLDALSELPRYARFDPFSGEFDSSPSLTEQESYSYLGVGKFPRRP